MLANYSVTSYAGNQSSSSSEQNDELESIANDTLVRQQKLMMRRHIKRIKKSRVWGNTSTRRVVVTHSNIIINFYCFRMYSSFVITKS